MNKAFKTLIFILIAAFIFKGAMYRMCVKYKAIGERQPIAITNQTLKEIVDSEVLKETISHKNIAGLASQVTMKILHFSSNSASQNPNDLINTKQANCVGYSALFNSVANYLIIKHQLQKEIVATHKYGELFFFGVNLHSYLNGPFFKSHDYNEIKNLKTEEVILIDPSLRDHTGVKFIVERY